jgi:ubiquinone/menaquinone biosynthesis C-methylase UbiE
MHSGTAGNVDHRTVEGFGEEWAAFTQEELSPSEHERLFDQYFSVFPFDNLPDDSEGFDLGCGTGRWAALAAPRVGRLHCIDPAGKALDVARRRLKSAANVIFHDSDVDHLPLADASQDFGYSLGVLHHIPDTQAAMGACVRKLKPGAPFLVYIYYAFDNRPAWFRAIWVGSEIGRRSISRLPFAARKAVTTVIAATIYWPLARTAKILEQLGATVGNLPLAEYRYRSFYSMRTDALDRLGTRLEQRFSKTQIEVMMLASGLENIRFREGPPFWCACGIKNPTVRG